MLALIIKSCLGYIFLNVGVAHCCLPSRLFFSPEKAQWKLSGYLKQAVLTQLPLQWKQVLCCIISSFLDLVILWEMKQTVQSGVFMKISAGQKLYYS